MSKKFSVDYLREELGLPWDKKIVIEDNILGLGRWNALHEIVFKDKDGKYWKTTYFAGLTEHQEEKPWEDREEVECTEVESKEVVVKVWMPIKEEEKEKNI